MITDTMKHILEINMMEPGLKMLRKPDEDGLKRCQEFGKTIAEKVKNRADVIEDEGEDNLRVEGCGWRILKKGGSNELLDVR